MQGDELIDRRSEFGIASGVHEQRAGNGVFAGADGGGGGINSVDGERLDGFVDEAEAGVADGGRGGLHALADGAVTSNVFRFVGNLLFAHDEFFEGFVGSAVGVAGDDDDGHVRPANFFPVGDFAGIDFADLIDGEVGYRIFRVNENRQTVERHDVSNRLDAFFGGGQEFVVFHGAGHGGHIANIVYEAFGAVATAGFADGDVHVWIRRHEVFGEGFGDRADGGGTVDDDFIFGDGGRRDGGDESDTEN